MSTFAVKHASFDNKKNCFLLIFIFYCKLIFQHRNKMKLDWVHFRTLGLEMIEKLPSHLADNVEATMTQDRDFRSQFGVNWRVCSSLWNLLDEHFSSAPGLKRQPKHLLWALMFLKTYANESTYRCLTGVTEKTFRKWAWHVIGEIADLSPMIVSYWC